MNNKIRLIKKNNKDEYSVEEFEINKDMDFSKNGICHDIRILDEKIIKGYTCKILLNIWKIVDKDEGFDFFDTKKLKDKSVLLGVGTSQNVFWVHNKNVYMRDISLNDSKICEGYIEYNKEKDCAVLTLKL
jgi:hypothetical protein